MALLPSEIYRLILGFLEDENLYETYKIFLSEAKYLEECRHYIKLGYQFQTTVHGKKLIDYLNLNFTRGFNSIATQTIDEQTYDMQTDSIKLNDLSRQIKPGFKDSSEPKAKKARKNATFKRKNTLLDLNPIKSFKQIEENNLPIESTEIVENFEETLFDIDSFIKNLCENDFPARLAQSINEMNLKKSSGNEPTIQNNVQEEIINSDFILKNNDNSNIITNESIEQNKIPVQQEPSEENTNAQSHDNQKEPVNLNKTELEFLEQSGLNSIKFWIANEDISTLAEHFSEPACEKLFEAFNSSRDVSLKDEENKIVENDSNKMQIEEINYQNNDKINNTILESNNQMIKSDQNNLTLNEPFNFSFDENKNEKTDKNSIKDPELNHEPIYSFSKDRNSMIVIAKNSDDITRIEKEWRESKQQYQLEKKLEQNNYKNLEPMDIDENQTKSDENIEFNGLNCLASAASSLVEKDQKNEKEEDSKFSEISSSQTSTPTKSKLAGKKSPVKKIKKIRDIYETQDNKDDVVVEKKDMEIEDKKRIDKSPSLKTKNRKYFYDFYNDMKDEVENSLILKTNVNNKSDDENLPDILKYARRVQDSAKLKFKNKQKYCKN